MPEQNPPESENDPIQQKTKSFSIMLKPSTRKGLQKARRQFSDFLGHETDLLSWDIFFFTLLGLFNNSKFAKSEKVIEVQEVPKR